VAGIIKTNFVKNSRRKDKTLILNLNHFFM